MKFKNIFDLVDQKSVGADIYTVLDNSEHAEDICNELNNLLNLLKEGKVEINDKK